MNTRSALFIVGIVFLVIILLLLFPALLELVEAFAGELKFFWWVILIVALAVWLVIWGFAKKDK
jgi:hypothetical protein